MDRDYKDKVLILLTVNIPFELQIYFHKQRVMSTEQHHQIKGVVWIYKQTCGPFLREIYNYEADIENSLKSNIAKSDEVDFQGEIKYRKKLDRVSSVWMTLKSVTESIRDLK